MLHLCVVGDVAVHDGEVDEVRLVRLRDGRHGTRVCRLELLELAQKLQDVLEVGSEGLARPPHLLCDALRSILLLETNEGGYPLEKNSAEKVRVVAVVHGGRVRADEEPARQHPVGLHGGTEVNIPLLVDR